ncbi:MAG: RNA polymerase sigma factor [Bacteroidetes bacterium]|nr:RNA polymerase sigma factor [Bacteroidota bacterium]
MVTKGNAFDHQIARELTPLRNYALSLTHDINESNDLVQDTVLKAFRYKEKFEDGTNLRGWLYTIMKNNFINNYRRNARRNTFLDSTDNLYFLDSGTVNSENPAELKFISKDLENAIDALAPELKITFSLNAEGFKYHEIAEELGIPIGTVKTRIFMARKILRERLSELGSAFGLLKKA